MRRGFEQLCRLITDSQDEASAGLRYGVPFVAKVIWDLTVIRTDHQKLVNKIVRRESDSQASRKNFFI
jgi:hypothetical protein